MTDSTAWQRTGRAPLDIASLLTRLASPAIWVEPDPVLPDDRRATGYPASRGLLTEPPPDVPLIEARGFWPTWAVHLVADGDGCRWMAVGDGAPPSWPDTLIPFETSALDVAHTRRKVLLRRQWRRFGVGEGAEPIHPAARWRGELDLIEYLEKGRRMAWRIVPREHK